MTTGALHDRRRDEQADRPDSHGEKADAVVGQQGHEHEHQHDVGPANVVCSGEERGSEARAASALAEVQVGEVHCSPGDQLGTDDHGKQHSEDLALKEVVEQHDRAHECAVEQQRTQWQTLLRGLAEVRGGLTVHRQVAQHARPRIRHGVAHRGDRGEDHEVEHVGGTVNTDKAKHAHKRAFRGILLIPRCQQQDHAHAADVEDEDPPDHRVDGLRNRALGILRFSGGGTDGHDAAKGEGHRNE
nr:Uncharacterised protein [Streptococcus thermophilus]